MNGSDDIQMLFSERLVSQLARARSVSVLTGAGVSAESGVATFRDPDGLWSKFRPEELANFDAFMRNPRLVWEWYSHRRTIIADVAPNPGHYALVEMEKLYGDFTLITQNVDNLHRRAGSSNVLELHGNIERSYCISCRTFYSNVDVSPPKSVPRCVCGGLIRPDVVWFGEMLPEREIQLAWEATERAEVFLSIGTSGEVQPAAQLPAVARRQGAFVAEINPRRSSIASTMHECVEGPAGVVLPSLVREIRRLRTTA